MCTNNLSSFLNEVLVIENPYFIRKFLSPIYERVRNSKEKHVQRMPLMSLGECIGGVFINLMI